MGELISTSPVPPASRRVLPQRHPSLPARHDPVPFCRPGSASTQEYGRWHGKAIEPWVKVIDGWLSLTGRCRASATRRRVWQRLVAEQGEDPLQNLERVAALETPDVSVLTILSSSSGQHLVGV